MGKVKKKIKDIWNKLRKKRQNLRTLLIHSWWYFLYYHTKLDENLVFIESRDGKDFTGNIFRIVEELSKKEYMHLKICVWANKSVHPTIQLLQKNYHLKRLKLVSTENRAVSVMERAKYIVSDSGVPWGYVKRKGQIVLNTWHGTPLKVMGRKVKGERHSIGTIQHFYFSSDYLLYPSDYMRNTMLRDYMVENVISGKALMSGYPRNSVFFDTERGQEMRQRLGFEGKTVFVYMPTHRGIWQRGKNRQQTEAVVDYLSEIDGHLKEDQVLLVKLHIFNQSQIDFSQFQRVQPFPVGYETYDVLNAADCLITDYSSVFFDFANTRKKIILFAYDEKEYFEDRGTYFPLSELPFPCVRDVQSLIKEMNIPKNYDDQAFLEKFCTYDSPDAAQKLCRHVFKGEKVCREVSPGNGKENVLIFGGSLAKNGITTALRSLLDHLDTSEKNYFVSFNRWEVNSEPSRVDVIPDVIDYLPLMSDQMYTFRERRCYDRYSRNRRDGTPYPRLLRRMFRRELDRCYWGANFSQIIQFDGYGKNVTLLLMGYPCKKAIFVHNDMVQEIKIKGYQHPPTLKTAYNEYDKVAVVTPDMIESTMELGAPRDKIVVVNNIHNAQRIQKRAELPISFERGTECQTYHPGGIEGVLNSKGKKFVTIGRFSPEKGHRRLLVAFDSFCDRYPDTQLIIIGGLGVLYQNTLRWARELRHWRNVTVIKAINNPMPILKRCDLFILSSFYEGLGLVILEADCLGVPPIATDIVGPRTFMKKHHGHLVEDSERGILQGMYDYVDGKVHTLDIDYEAYNQTAKEEFMHLFEEGDRK